LDILLIFFLMEIHGSTTINGKNMGIMGSQHSDVPFGFFVEGEKHGRAHERREEGKTEDEAFSAGLSETAATGGGAAGG
jgi:hypothetical protein